MKVIRNLKDITPDLHGCFVSIGNFDGVHLAHQQIIGKVVKEAQANHRKAVVMTFEPHPQKVLRPDQIPFYLITTLEEKLAILDSLQVDATILIEFTREFSKTTAEEFIRQTICATLRPQKVLIGHDYTFGKGKEGKPEYLRSLGQQCGFEVEVIPAVLIDNGIVSSTRVRHAIQRGDLKEASHLLGRPYTINGPVEKGFQRGSEIGFPTANIRPDKELLPPEGVYAVFVELNGAKHPAVANIGYNPTFANENLSFEIHLLDFRGDLYGSDLKILLIQRLREERKFESPERLVEQIRKDIANTRDILAVS
jgi:riboflavin kinase / FMN adenylyltransferase